MKTSLANPQRLRYRPRVTEAFPFLDCLNSIPGVRAAWIGRVPDLSISGDRDEAMISLRPHHERLVADFADSSAEWWRAEQVHGTRVMVVPGCSQILAADGLPVVPGCDGLVTCQTGIVLAIYAADCGAIWLADRKTGAIGMLHSGKKGTEGNIFSVALGVMAEQFGTRAEDVTAVLSPCIRIPDYDVDFAGEIGKQAAVAGVGTFLDCGLNTASDLQRNYSYRRELGKTGRMMAMIVRDFLP
jgi:copper oxidase (laccase) domain-containing protein